MAVTLLEVQPAEDSFSFPHSVPPSHFAQGIVVTPGASRTHFDAVNCRAIVYNPKARM